MTRATSKENDEVLPRKKKSVMRGFPKVVPRRFAWRGPVDGLKPSGAEALRKRGSEGTGAEEAFPVEPKSQKPKQRISSFWTSESKIVRRKRRVFVDEKNLHQG